MKVLMVNKFHYLKGGSETYHFAVGEGLKALGHEVAWFAMQDPRNIPCEQSKYFVTASDYTGKASLAKKAKDGFSLVYNREAKRKFDQLVREFEPDIIHLNLVHRQLTFSILDAQSARGIPVVYTAHDYISVCPNYTMMDNKGNVCEDCLKGSFLPCLKKSCVKRSRAKSALATFEAAYLKHRAMYNRFDRVIAPSDFMKAKLVEGGFDSAQVIKMQNFASPIIMDQARKETDLGLRHREQSILFAGRLSKEKGVDVLVRAFLKIADEIPSEWRLVIAGDGSEHIALEALLEDKRNAHRVNLVGFLDAKKMREAMGRSALSSISSRWRENMPYSVIEAFAAGTPVIGTRIGGIPELVIEGSTGFLAEPDNVDDLARTLKQAIDLVVHSPETYERMQRSCRQYVLERCDGSAYLTNLLELYKGLMSEKAYVYNK